MADTARNDIDALIGEHYVPSALERKKSLMMYVLWGILLSLSQQKASRYEQFHLKQALGRWTMFFLLIIPAIVLAFIPWIRVLPLLAYVALFSVRIIFFMQAWKGTYTSFAQDKPFLPIFAGFGSWVLSIFDMKLEDGLMEGEITQAQSTDQPVINQSAINQTTLQTTNNQEAGVQPPTPQQ